MDEFKLYIVKNFILICLSIVLYVNSILRYRQHKELSKCVITITSIAVYLSIANAIQEHIQNQGNIIGTTIISFIGYVIRPVCITLLIRVSGFKIKKQLSFLLWLPLAINATIYLFAFIPATKEAVFYFTENEFGNVVFGGGPLRFSSHIISALYLSFLLYISISNLKGKHITHGLSILFCSLFIVAAVVIESFFSNDGEINYLLNNTIVASTVVYYLFLYTEKSQIDILTGLFNRETFYQDVDKMGKSITAVIQFDMNGLKYLNDNFGHQEGDKALYTLGNIIYDNSTRKMYVYRLGGDEFTLLAIGTSESKIQQVVAKIKEDLSKTKYYCSIGYSHQQGRNIPIDELLNEAEERMYQDKAKFYENADFDRRKV